MCIYRLTPVTEMHGLTQRVEGFNHRGENADLMPSSLTGSIDSVCVSLKHIGSFWACTHQQAGKCQTLLFSPLLWYSTAVSQLNFRCLLYACPRAFQWRWRGWASRASGVVAGERLAWMDVCVYRVNQSCANPWLPLTFTGGPFAINVQGPLPLEAWLRISPDKLANL